MDAFKTEIIRLKTRYYLLLILDGICLFMGVFSFLMMISSGLKIAGLIVLDLQLVLIMSSVSMGTGLVWSLASMKTFKAELVSADQRLGWKDRMSTAFECHSANSIYRDGLVRDALVHIQSLESKLILPFTFPRSFFCFLLFALIAGTINLFGSFPSEEQIFFSRSTPELGEVAGKIRDMGRQLLPEQEKEGKSSIAKQIRETARQMTGATPEGPKGAVRSLSGLFDLINGKTGQDIQDLEKKMGKGQASSDIIAPSLGPNHTQKRQQFALNDLKEKIAEAFDEEVPEDLADALENIENQLTLQDLLKDAIRELENKGKENRTEDSGPDSAGLPGGKGKAIAERDAPDADESGAGQGEEAGSHKVSDHEKELAGILSDPSNRIKPNPSAPVKDEIGRFEGGAFRASIRAITAPGISLKAEKEIQRTYVRQKEEILLKEPVPVEYKAVIRDYFLSIGLEKE